MKKYKDLFLRNAKVNSNLLEGGGVYLYLTPEQSKKLIQKLYLLGEADGMLLADKIQGALDS